MPDGNTAFREDLEVECLMPSAQAAEAGDGPEIVYAGVGVFDLHLQLDVMASRRTGNQFRNGLRENCLLPGALVPRTG